MVTIGNMNKERKKIHNRLYYCRKLYSKISAEYNKLGGCGYLNYYLSIKCLESEILELVKKLNKDG